MMTFQTRVRSSDCPIELLLFNKVNDTSIYLTVWTIKYKDHQRLLFVIRKKMQNLTLNLNILIYSPLHTKLHN